MTYNFDYKNFYQLLKIENKTEQENQLKHLIDSYLCHHFYVEDRNWFNLLINYGLINVVKHCENTIPDFSLFDYSKDCHHKSNLCFLKAIQSSNLELVDYFFNHKDFSKFCESDNINQSVANFLTFHNTSIKKFDLQNFEKLVLKLAEKFPLFVPIALDKFVRSQQHDEISPALISLVKKYTNQLESYFDSSPTENNYTRLCMVSLNYNCVEFAGFLRSQYQNIDFQSELVSFYLLFFHKEHTFNYIFKHPDFFTLTKNNFTKMFEYIFNNNVDKTFSKEDYQFFFKVTKLNLHEVTKEEMQSAINKNLTTFVKKYYTQFKNEDFDVSRENNCTRFINKNKTEQMYKDYLKKYPTKNIVEKKIKI